MCDCVCVCGYLDKNMMVSPSHDGRSLGPRAKGPDISADCIGSMVLNSWAAGWLRGWRRRLAAVATAASGCKRETGCSSVFVWKTFDPAHFIEINNIYFHEMLKKYIVAPRCGPTAHGLGSMVSNTRRAVSWLLGSLGAGGLACWWGWG